MSSKALKKRKAGDLGLDKISSKSVRKRKACNKVMDDMSLKSIGQEISNDADVDKMSSKSSCKRKASYADLDPGEGTSDGKQLKLPSKLSDSSSIAGPSKDSSGNSSFEKLRHVFTSSEFSSSEIKSFSLEDSFESPKEMTKFDIPDTVNVLKFAECRAAEIATLMQEVESKKPKLIMQQLPRHMRRRAASHNANRIPRRLREMALKEIQKSKKTKRPSRKHRRRPSNLLFEYNRRQREFVWLETHIWFAKRFKMAELWGYKLPLHPNDKSVRASYRASTKHVLIQDLSYMACIELKGIANVLLQGLSQLTCTSAGLTFAAKMYVSGSREGHVVLYHPNCYPFQCIGPVSFLWKPIYDTITVGNSEVPNDIIRQLWIWCHPSCYEELVKVFQLIFKLKEDTLKGEKYGLLSNHSKEVQDASDASNEICKTAKNTTSEESSFELKGFITPKVEKCSESLSSHSEDQKVLTTSNKTLKTKKKAMSIKSAFELKGFIAPKVEKCSESMSSLSEDNVSDISSEILKITKSAASKGSAFKLKGHNAPKVETCSESFSSCSEDKVLDTSEKCKSTKNITFRDHPSKGSKNDLERTEKCDEKVSLRFKKYVFYTGNDITMTLLKDTLVRHRLIGPLAQAVITDTLKHADVGFGQKESISLTQRQKWWETYYGNQKMKSVHQKQKELWQQMHGAQSPGQLPPGVILGLTVKDPRMDLPKVKTKVVNKPEEVWRATPSQWIHSSIQYESSQSSMSLSPLWEQEIRDEVTITKQTESQLNALRSQFLVPGTPLNLGKDESRVPLIVIQQPGNEGCSGGWDIIAPLGWSMPFWIAFIYRGARASGLRELRSVYHEVGMPLFPFNYPDTFSGQKTAEQNRKDTMAKHLRYPPDKRPSFNKLGIVAPFFVPWEKLVAEWELELVTKSKQFGNSRSAVVVTLNNVPNCTVNSNNSELKSVLPNVQLTKCSELSSFYVLRDRKLLNLLRESTTVRKQFTPKPVSNMKACLENLICRVKNDSGLRKALLCVKVKLTTKGNPCEYSALYLPTDGDIKTIKQNPQFGGPTEPSHPAKKIPKEPKKKRKSSIQKQKVSQNVQDNSVECSDSVELLRPEVDTIISTCCRKMIGSVEVGGYSFINACGFGLGHCAFIGFVELLQMCYYAKMPPTVLVRSQSSFQYRFAKIDVV